jgi:hypothetical protein
MDPRTIDLTGKTFGSWTVLGYGGSTAKRATGATWLCRCVCGTERPINTKVLRYGHSKSCGCKKGELIKESVTKHGHTVGHNMGKRRTPEYNVWAAIKTRCYNPNCKQYPLYGAKGIGMYKPWRKNFAAFFAHVGRRPSPEYVIGRIDHTKNYQPGNCRWITKRENSIEANKGYRPPGWSKRHPLK